MSLAATTSLRLTDGTLIVRPWRDGDAAALHAAVRESADTLGRWLSWFSENYSLSDSERWVTESEVQWRAGLEFRFVILEADEPHRLLGGIGLNHINPAHRLANLGYWVRGSATQRGVATRAARLVVRHALTSLELGRVEILTAVENLPSRRVAEKLGASFEGVLRDRLYMHGAWVAACMYSLVRGDVRSW